VGAHASAAANAASQVARIAASGGLVALPGQATELGSSERSGEREAALLDLWTAPPSPRLQVRRPQGPQRPTLERSPLLRKPSVRFSGKSSTQELLQRLCAIEKNIR
jgi:hypothetical protein